MHAVAVENTVPPFGMPDVSYAGGWVELKWLPKWPRRDTTRVRIDHFTREQRRWLTLRHEAGEDTWLLLQVRREWLLMRGPVAAEVVGKLSRIELMRASDRVWLTGLKRGELHRHMEAARALRRGEYGIEISTDVRP